MEVVAAGSETIHWIRELVESAGPFGWLVYLLLVTVEVVVAPLPGVLLYIPGGMIFGPWRGGSLALAGNVLGAGLAAALANRIGDRLRRRIDPDNQLQRLQSLLQQRSTTLIILLRLNPLTSSDLVSYAAGMAGVKPRRVMLATAVGIMPLCYLQSHLSDTVFRVWPGLLLPLIGITIVLLLAVLLFSVRRGDSA